MLFKIVVFIDNFLNLSYSFLWLKLLKKESKMSGMAVNSKTAQMMLHNH